MAELTVFDIQRFALHDGPGIRTTVFLKGCPLNCVWCHNPESKRPEPQLAFIEGKCVSCGRCARVCEHGAHVIDKNGAHHIDRARCRACGRCVGECYRGALKIYGKKMTEREILDIVSRDRDFYRTAGGGLTVSGGEPMAQFDGLLQLLKAAGDEGLSVCLDTCGQAPTAYYEQIAPYVDIFLFDYKLTGAQAHQRYVGTPQRLILQNLDRLCTSGCRMILRCPIIPGINDFPAHYDTIAALSERYEAIEAVNLMPYHDMARGKAAEIGEAYALPGLASMTPAQIDALYAELAARGCRKLARA